MCECRIVFDLRLIQEGQGFTITLGLAAYLKARTDNIAITDDDD